MINQIRKSGTLKPASRIQGSRFYLRIPAILFLLATLVIFVPADDKEVKLPDFSEYIQITKSVQKNMPFSPGGQIHINTGFMGNITIEGWKRPQVSVEAVVTVWGVDHDALLANIVLIEPHFIHEETRIDIYTEHPEKFSMGKVDYTIKVPEFRSDLKVRSIRGFISVRNVNGWIEADTKLGYLSLVELKGYVSATTDKGDILAHLKGRRWEGLQFSATTKNGAIKLYMPSHYNTDLTLITTNGTVQSDYPPFMKDGEESALAVLQKKDGQFISQKIRDGGPSISIQTEKGDVKLFKYEADMEYLELENKKNAGEKE